jgi:uncharacterized membrane protein YeaQ/YmgE (transglycosylase-associated protein family)
MTARPRLLLAASPVMPILTLLVVGLIAGVLAAELMRGSGYGLVADILLGIAGAFIGDWGFRQLHWHAPFAGLAGVITVAFLGAVALLIVVRAIKYAGMRGRHA